MTYKSAVQKYSLKVMSKTAAKRSAKKDVNCFVKNVGSKVEYKRDVQKLRVNVMLKNCVQK